MAWSKTKITVVIIVILLLINAIGTVVVLVIQRSRPPIGTTLTSQPGQPSAEPSAPTNAPLADEVFPDDALVTGEFVAPPADQEGFMSLFNGRDLAGWNYNPHVWSVSNDVIAARVAEALPSRPYYLTWAGGELGDFELRLKVRTIAAANSGVCLRARWSDRRWMPGYQAEIARQDTGLLVIAGAGRERKLSRAGARTIAREENGQAVLEEVEALPEANRVPEVQALLQSSQWCDYAVLARGTHFIISLNGVTIVDTRDEHPTKAVARGMLGLEYNHRLGKPDSVEFKSIRLKRL